MTDYTRRDVLRGAAAGAVAGLAGCTIPGIGGSDKTSYEQGKYYNALDYFDISKEGETLGTGFNPENIPVYRVEVKHLDGFGGLIDTNPFSDGNPFDGELEEPMPPQEVEDLYSEKLGLEGFEEEPVPGLGTYLYPGIGRVVTPGIHETNKLSFAWDINPDTPVERHGENIRPRFYWETGDGFERTSPLTTALDLAKREESLIGYAEREPGVAMGTLRLDNVESHILPSNIDRYYIELEHPASANTVGIWTA